MNIAPNSPIADSTIVAILRQRAAREPDRTAFIHLISDHERESLTYGELDRRAAGIARWLIEHGAGGKRVILAHPTGLAFIAAFFGCLYAGAQAVPQPAYLRPRHLQKLAAIASDCGAAMGLTDSATLGRLLGARLKDSKGLAWTASDQIAPADGSAPLPPVEAHSLAYLQYTSGSTAAPRGVCISHANLMAHLSDLTRSYGAGPDDVLVSWLPHFHDMGLVGKPLFAVYLGASCVMLSPLQFMQRPARWLQAITDFRGTISAAPNFAYELCAAKIAPDQRQSLDLSHWRLALNGAEPVRAETHRRFLAAFAPQDLQPQALSPCYGLAEATLMVSTSLPSQPARIVAFDRASILARKPLPANGANAVELVGCGPPNAGVRVAIIDPDMGAEVSDGAIGEIWVKGASIAEGYFVAPEASAETFGARLGNDEGPYLRTGDLGFLHEGELFIAGRLKDLIIVNGRNLYPQDIEQSAQAGQPALIAGRGAAFGVDRGEGERLVLVQELHREVAGHKVADLDMSALITEMRAAILNEHEVHAAAILLTAPGTLPVTSSGKLARHAARDLFLAGRLIHLAAWHEPGWPLPAAANL
jgi:acyl-CoA synthetase (AMP-forming)/AMP-acid ligase II